jgi:hypothetical protein
MMSPLVVARVMPSVMSAFGEPGVRPVLPELPDGLT